VCFESRIFLVLYLLLVVASSLWYNGPYLRMKLEGAGIT